MGTEHLILTLVALPVAIVVATFVFRDVCGQRLLSRVAHLECSLATAPATTRKEIEAFQAKHGYVDSSNSKSTKIRTAILWSETLLLVLDTQENAAECAKERLEKIRSNASGRALKSCLFRYYRLCSIDSNEADKLRQLAILGQLECSATDRNQAVYQLRENTTPRVGMLRQELRILLAKIRLIKRSMPASSWVCINELEALCAMKEWQSVEVKLAEVRQRFGNLHELRLISARVLRCVHKNDSMAAETLSALANEVLCPPRIKLLAADEFYRLGQNELADEVLENLRQAQSSQPAVIAEAAAVRATAQARLKNYVEATSELAGHCNSSLVHARILAQIHLNLGHTEQAKIVLSKLTHATENPQPALMWALAIVYWNSQDWRLAFRWFERCSQIGWCRGEATHYAARCLVNLGVRRKAIELLRNIESSNATLRSHCQFLEGVDLFRNGKPQAALQCFSAAQKTVVAKRGSLFIRAGTNGSACSLAIAKRLFVKGDYENALPVISNLIKGIHRTDKNKIALSSIGREMRKRLAYQLLNTHDANAPKRALSLLTHGSSANRNSTTEFLIGVAFTQQKQYSKAIDHFTAGLKSPFDPMLLQFAIATCKLRIMPGSKRFLRAISKSDSPFRLQAAIVLANSAVTQHLSQQSESQAQLDEQIAELHSSLLSRTNTEPFVKSARCLLVQMAVRAGNAELALKQLNVLTRHDEKTPNRAVILLAILFAQQSNTSKAIQLLPELIDARVFSPDVRRCLKAVRIRQAASQWRKGDSHGAISVLEGHQKSGPSRELTDQLTILQMTNASSASPPDQERLADALYRVCKSSPSPDGRCLQQTVIRLYRQASLTFQSGHCKHAIRRIKHGNELLPALKRSKKFWNEYVQAYNSKEKYRLGISGKVLCERIIERLASFNVAAVVELLHDPNTSCDNVGDNFSANPCLADAQEFWSAATELIGVNRGRAAFEAILVIENYVSAGRQHFPGSLLRRLCWIYQTISDSPRVKSTLLATADRMAVKALVSTRISEFMETFETISVIAPEHGDLAKSLRQLGSSCISRIVAEMNRSHSAKSIKSARPDLFPIILLRMVICFASVSEVHNCPHLISATFERMLFLQIQELGK